MPDETPPSYETVLVDLDEGVATLTFNRPERMNAWNGVMAREISESLQWADATDAVRVVVITGAGRAFCAGADLSQGGDTFAEGRNQTAEEAVKETFPWDIRKPVIAAINGAAVGVGATFSLTCDIRYAAEDAKIGFVFVRRGQLPELASHAVLPRVVGMSNAADLLFTGRIVLGSEAARMGLVSEALPTDQVLSRALETARMIATYAAPVSVATAKQLMWTGIDQSIAEMQAREVPLFGHIAAQADSIEGVESFIEKRDPDWKLSVNKDYPSHLL
ncbi:MAG: enoyl-CoA hydratase/carnithine racemase [Candidatus Poriferisodalaceae bacterium]|jgi:enoyl-CoA hydratase/carnithine racemase